jgi:hypothetical protein
MGQGCYNPSHSVNSEKLSSAADLSCSLRSLTFSLWNRISMHEIKGVFILSSIEAMGIIPSDKEDGLGLDRVINLYRPLTLLNR